MTSVTKCVFCCDNADTKIILFKEDILQKCTDILKVRVAYKFKYAYNDVLPATPDEINGYHTTCYKTFTAIKQKYVDKYNDSLKSQQPANPTSESETLSSIHGKYAIFYINFFCYNLKAFIF